MISYRHYASVSLRNHQNQQKGSQIGERSFIRSRILARILLWNVNVSGQRVSGSPAAGPGHGQPVTLSPSPCSCSVASSPPRVEGSVLSAPAPEAALRLRPSPLQPRTLRGAANAAPGSSLHVCPSSEQAERNNRRRETKQHGQLGSA